MPSRVPCANDSGPSSTVARLRQTSGRTTIRPPLTCNAWLRYDLISRALTRLPPSSRVLEIGAGRGAMGARLSAMFQYTGIEADSDAASVAADAILPRGGELICGDMRDAPPGPFDGVCAFEVLEHIEDDVAALANWVSRLRPGGRIVLTVPAHEHRFGPADVFVGHYRRYSPEALERLLAEAGLQAIDVRVYGFPLGYALEIVRDRLARRSSDSLVESEQQLAKGTARSGRWLQPSMLSGVITWLTALPFRGLQRPFVRTRLGTGLVATARRPAG